MIDYKMSLVTPAPRSGGPNKGGARRQENNRIYAHPLPLLFINPPPGRIRSLLGLVGLSLTRVENPHCEGVFDHATRSVWTGKQKTSEEVTAKRRAERKQFKLDRAKAIAAVAAEAENIFTTEGRVIQPALSGPAIPSAATWRPAASSLETPDIQAPIEQKPEIDEELVEDIEHLQLTLPEAFFLLWTMDCLTVLNRDSQVMRIQDIWTAFQAAHLPPIIPQPPLLILQLDNPFLINYVVYHHYRSLGWVVKGASNSVFAIVVCPVYEDPEDQNVSSFDLQNSSPFSWTWLSTINRVNSQVQKTLILVYVTVPARSRVPTSILDTPACLAYYSLREVTLRRFIPARMRD
ncbi:hypothetical protein BD779DRAFT_1738552 [Infundibulicybe gibba]|nr:hypothetical protein BD779DRAFT_1738552 [Infundibulicybe gibba]